VTNYTKSTNFASKDSLPTGNSNKIVKGTEIDTEFNNIATAVNTKADTASPTFTGVPLAPTAASGTNTTQLATTAFVKAANDTQDTAIALKAPLASPTFTGVPAVPTAAVNTNTTQVASTAFVLAQAASATPLTNGTAAVGTATKYAREDHVHAITPISTATAVATTSGTYVDFTSIPSWVKRITVMFNGVSTNGVSRLMVQLGTSGGIVTTGYLGQSSNPAGTSSTFSNSFIVNENVSATDARYGQIILSNMSGNIWSESGVTSVAASSTPTSSAGIVSLGATLNSLRVTTVSGDTFDAGSINILYE